MHLIPSLIRRYVCLMPGEQAGPEACNLCQLSGGGAVDGLDGHALNQRSEEAGKNLRVDVRRNLAICNAPFYTATEQVQRFGAHATHMGGKRRVVGGAIEDGCRDHAATRRALP